MVCETSMAVPPPLSRMSCAISSAEAHAYADDDQRCLVNRLSASRLGVNGEHKVTLAAQQAATHPPRHAPLERTSGICEIFKKMPLPFAEM